MQFVITQIYCTSLKMAIRRINQIRSQSQPTTLILGTYIRDISIKLVY